MKIRPVEAELFYADRQTDRQDEANSRFSQFCEKRLKTNETFPNLQPFTADWNRS